MTRLFLSTLLLLSIGSVAAAQPAQSDLSINSFNPGDPVAPMADVEATGWKVGEGTVLLPVFGIETGVVNNVFYEEDNANSSGVLRLMAQFGIGSLTSTRLRGTDGSEVHQGQFEYRADLRLSYDQMLSGNDAVSETGGLGVGAALRGTVNPAGTWAFAFADDFRRLIRAANFETDANTDRDINNLGLKVLFQPEDHTIHGQLYYNNTIDVFERSEQKFANRILHQIGLRPTWRWLPQTQFFADASLGIQSGLGSAADMKSSSYPLTIVGGINTLLTEKTTVNLQAGYTNGFYSSGPSYSSVTAGAAFGYRYSPLGRVVVTYDLSYADSVNANFYRDHTLRLWVHQQISPVVFSVQPEIHLRRYEGTLVAGVGGQTTRDDVIVAVTGGVHYNLKNSLAATLDYRFSMLSTDFAYMTDSIIDDPSFTRHELLLGVRMAL